ncbi:hypothetical protein ACFQ7F_02340 [Streptomyces sp. NPDC056486]|uniref:hypothetical protein n=1 Tax=Streptomyces sp. NPDC056486 TaxID=3345835 RepID=UPI00368DC68A
MNERAPVDKQGLLHFLRDWYGDPTSPSAKAKSSRSAPKELIEWHEISTQWDGRITSHNYAIPLPELEVHDGKVPFWVENQGTWLWAFDPDDQDHLVYEQEPSGDPAPWAPTSESLPEFLIHATVMEAILGAPARKIATGVDAEWLLTRENVSPLPSPPWNWPARESRILLGEDWLALVHPSDEPELGYDITLAAITPENLLWAETTPGIEWRSYADSQDYTTDEPLPW